MFYGLPIHIMRDLFMTARSFVKRLGALMRYRKALQDMNKYPDATQEDLDREDTCIICREEMRPWDPSVVGAVERSRPKKLPCGHILHFGCLKGWLERQQVCPTCRRPVVIDGAGPDGAAPGPGPNVGGQPRPLAQAAPGGGAGAGGGAANPGRPDQARANLRVFQFGPIQFGLLQGNDQNMHDLANQLRLPLDGANQPVAPAAIRTPTPVVTPAHHNNSQRSIESIQVQLQEISERIQQEMYALQATQAELQTLYDMTVELNRLRQTQETQPQIANLGSQPAGISTQFAFQQSLQPLPNSASPNPSSLNTRHGGASYASAIPSGSQDLPQGVSIPPGWSLLPLQRLDGQTSQHHAGPQSFSIPPPHDPSQQQHQTVPHFSRHNISNNLQGTARSSAPSTDVNASSRHNEGHNGSDRNPDASTSQAQREPPEVAAPTPVVPQWGGSTHLLFGNHGGSSTPSAADNSTARSDTVAEDRPDAADSSDSDEESDGSGGKGKAKAVTVEDVEDESD